MSDLGIHDPRQFMPKGSDKARGKREALMVARDYAAMLRTRVRSELAITMAAEVQELASTYAFAEASEDRLTIVVNCCRNMVQAAMCLDHLESEALQ